MRSIRFLALGICCLALAAAGCRRPGSGKERGPSRGGGVVSDRAAVLATLSEENAPPAPRSPPGLGLHAPFDPSPEFTFSSLGGGVVYLAEKGGQFQVFHNGRAGRPYGAVGDLTISPDGRRTAYGVVTGGRWRMVVDGEESKDYLAIQSPQFSPDSAHLAYRAMVGDRWFLVVDGKENGGTSTRYLDLAFVAGSSRVAYLESAQGEDRGPLLLADLALKNPVVVAPDVTQLVTNADGSRIAAVAVTPEGQRVLTFEVGKPTEIARGASFEAVSGLAFGPDGVAVTYVGERAGKSYVVLDGKEEPYPANVMMGPPLVLPDGKGAMALMWLNGTVRLYRFFAAAGPPGPIYAEAEGLVVSDDGKLHAYAARRGEKWLLVVNGVEGPELDRVVGPSFSPDWKYVVYRARQDGKRFVVIADPGAKTLRQHAAYERVYPPMFTADGKSVAYGVKAGKQLAWKVEPL